MTIHLSGILTDNTNFNGDVEYYLILKDNKPIVYQRTHNKYKHIYVDDFIFTDETQGFQIIYDNPELTINHCLCKSDTTTGPQGPPGPAGPQGITGPAGSNGQQSQYLIPYASGLSYMYLENVNAKPTTSYILGYGTSKSINQTEDILNVNNYGYVVPNKAMITDISILVYTTYIFPNTLNTELKVRACLYQSTTPNNTFTIIPESVVILNPPFIGSVPRFNAITGSVSGLNIQVNPGTLIILVLSLVSDDDKGTCVIECSMSGGVKLVSS